MATSTKPRKPKAKEAARSVSNAPVFPKERILTFQRYANRRDLLSILLKDGQEYTHDQVQNLIDNFMKGKVK